MAGLEWESPEAGAIGFTPSLQDAMPVGMNDGHFRLGEDDRAVKVGNWAKLTRVWGKKGITCPCVAA